MVKIVNDAETKKRITRTILEALPDWFEIEESREKYIAESADQIMVASWDGANPCQIYVMTTD